jgi:NADPH2:quinone reductase
VLKPRALPGEGAGRCLNLPDVLAREGVHPETPRVYARLGPGRQCGRDRESVSGFELGQTVAAMPISGCYA